MGHEYPAFEAFLLVILVSKLKHAKNGSMQPKLHRETSQLQHLYSFSNSSFFHYLLLLWVPLCFVSENISNSNNNVKSYSFNY